MNPTRTLAVFLGVLFCAEAALPPGHDAPARSGHPRLLFAAGDLPALRTKVTASGSLAKSYFDPAMANAYRPSQYKPGYVDNSCPTSALTPGIFEALLASPPALSCLHPDAEQRRLWARYAIESSLKVIRTQRPPYAESPEWQGRAMGRWIALTYDCCQDRMSASERAEFLEELQQVCAAYRFKVGPDNHGMASATVVALSALAIDGDVPGGVQRTITETLVHNNSLPNATNPADFASYHELQDDAALTVRLTPTSTPYVKGVDYKVQYQAYLDAGGAWSAGYALVWQAGKPRPAHGQSFQVTYHTTPDPVFWKDVARSAVQASLDRMWMDGSAAAGVFYGGWALNWLMDAVEAFRLNSPYDFSVHPNLASIMQWLPTELIAGHGNALSVNNRNDSNYGDLALVQSWPGPYLAWAMARYPGPSRAGAANWLLRRKPVGGFQPWREALWCTEAYGGPGAAATLPLPPSRIFRGVGVSNFRDGSWNGPADDWALLSQSSGPWMGEHDHVDRGSFTFYACGEDFAVDTGYAFSDPRNNATAGHNYVLIDGAGQPGPFSFAELAEGFTTGFADAVRSDLKRSFVHSNTLAADPASWPVRRADRYTLLVKVPGRAPYALVADDLEKDGAAHTYEWGMHTQAGNTVSYLADGFRIQGRRGLASLDLHLASSAPATLSASTWTGSSIGSHLKLKAAVAGVANPRFLALMEPVKTGQPALSPVLQRGNACTSASLTLPGGGKDWILFNDGSAAVSAGDLSTDGVLALVRTDAAGAVKAWTAFGATALSWKGKPLWTASARGAAAWDGGAMAYLEADEAGSLSAFCPNAMFFNVRGRGLFGTRDGDYLSWNGDRRLADVSLQGPAMSEGFDAGVSRGWHVFNDGGYSRIVDGELCSLGLKEAWLSYTTRPVAPARGDLAAPARTCFRDATLTGSFRLESGGLSAPLVFYARVSDRSLPAGWPPGVDQDSVRVELTPGSGRLAALVRKGGIETLVASNGVPALALGTVHTYALRTDGSTLIFELDSVRVIEAKGDLPAQGYFQWKLPAGLHVHLDEITVELPGNTVASPDAAPVSGSGPVETQEPEALLK